MAHRVKFSDGRTVTFRDTARSRRRRSSAVTGTPYLFTKGPKIHLPKGAAKGSVFRKGRKTYLAVKYTNAYGDRIEYGQPITLL